MLCLETQVNSPPANQELTFLDLKTTAICIASRRDGVCNDRQIDLVWGQPSALHHGENGICSDRQIDLVLGQPSALHHGENGVCGDRQIDLV